MFRCEPGNGNADLIVHGIRRTGRRDRDVRSDGAAGIAAESASLSGRLRLDADGIRRAARIGRGKSLSRIGGKGQHVGLAVLHDQGSRVRPVTATLIV